MAFNALFANHSRNLIIRTNNESCIRSSAKFLKLQRLRSHLQTFYDLTSCIRSGCEIYNSKYDSYGNYFQHDLVIGEVAKLY